MKASESIPNYDIKVREYTNYTLKSIKNVCKQFGPRPLGSEGELKAQEYVQNDLNKFCDETRREEFSGSDKAFMSWVPIGAVLLFLGAVSFTLGWAVVSLVLSVLTLVMVLAEFIFYVPLLDLFFPKKKSANIVGVRKSSGETKKRVILSGHLDSAYEWTYTYKGGHAMVAAIIGNAIGCVALEIIGSIVGMILVHGAIGSVVWSANGSVVLRVFAVLFYLSMPLDLFALNFCNYKRPVTGANDNLTGVFSCCAAAKYLFDNDIRFEHTEVMVVSTSGEEAGLRGAKAFVKAHGDEFKKDGVKTVCFGLDTINDLSFAKIYEKDMTGVVCNDHAASELLQKAAKNAGFDAPIGVIELGATDAAAFSQGGLRATSMACMDPAPAKFYHTRLDTVDALCASAVDAGVKTAIETVFLFDEKEI